MNHSSHKGWPIFLILVFTLIVLLSYTRQKYSKVSSSVFQHIQEKGTTTPPKCLNTSDFATPVNPSQIVYFLAPPACFSFTCGQITSLFACVYGSMATKRVALPQREPWRGKENWEERSDWVYFGWKKEEKRNDRNELEGSSDREAEMLEKNDWNTLESEVFLTVVVTAAGRQNGEHMWKQSSSKWLLIASSIGWAMFPNPQQRQLTDCMCLVGVCFLLLLQLAQTAISFLIVPKKMMMMMMSEK